MTKPCVSNDHPLPTNESNDFMAWSLSRKGGGSGCEDHAVEEEIEEDAIVPTSDADVTKSFLSCNSASALELSKADGVQRVDFVYDYEIHTSEDADFESSVNAFEHGLLNGVADDFGLSFCELTRRSLRKGRKLDDASSVVGVGSHPNDAIDSVHTECIVDVQAIEPSVCTPMIGMMTAWVSESGRRRLYSAESEIYTSIEEYSTTYNDVEEGILAVSYIGTRPGVPFIGKAKTDDGKRDDLASGSSAITPGAIAGITVASVLAVLAVMALIAKKRKGGKNEAEKSEVSVVDDALFMSDDEEEMKEVRDDISNMSSDTEDYTHEETLAPSATFESEHDNGQGFEVLKL